MQVDGEVVGVDGWRGGWIAAVVRGRRVEWRVYDAFEAITRAWPESTIAVDMPIATTDGPRVVDEAGRAWLRAHGGPWQSIFLTPSTATVAAWEARRTHAEAMAERGDAPGTSIQAWNLIPRIVDVRDALAATPSASVIEAHPECSFRVLDERIGTASKKTGRGAGLRLRALASVFDVDLAEAPADVPVDDLLDACVVAWTAQRWNSGKAIVLPEGASTPPRIVV